MPISQNTQICPAYLKMFRNQTAMRDSGLNTAGYGMNINLNVGGQDINFGGRIYNRFKEINIMRRRARSSRGTVRTIISTVARGAGRTRRRHR